MALVRTFVTSFVLGLAVASFAAWQIAVSFRTLDEFDIVELALIVFTTVVTAIFAAVCATAGGDRWLAPSALGLVLVATAFSGFPPWMRAVDARSSNPYPGDYRDAQIVLEFLVPALMAVTVIWRLAVRNRLIATGADPRTLWPWITIALGAALIFNPFGLAILSSAIKQSPTDWIAGLWLMVAVGAAAFLLVAACIERALRARNFSRRSDRSAG